MLISQHFCKSQSQIYLNITLSSKWADSDSLNIGLRVTFKVRLNYYSRKAWKKAHAPRDEVPSLKLRKW